VFAGNTLKKLIGCIFLIMALPIVQAACDDPAAAKVDWYLCVKNNEVFRDGQILSESNLQLVSLNRAQLRFVDLKGSNLSKAHISEANLIGANLRGAILGGTILTDTVLYAADLTGADLRGAVLIRTNLINAKLTNANLTGALWADGKHFCGEGSIGMCKLPPSKK
jgi:uncharacterized protein YjbI with pentapeptide repeats